MSLKHQFDECAEKLKLHEPMITGPFSRFRVESCGDWVEMEEQARKRIAPFQKQLDIDQHLGATLALGIPPKCRRKWWFVASGGLKLYCEVGDLYESAVEAAKAAKRTDAMYFGGLVKILGLFPDEVKKELDEFLHTLWFYNRDLEFCPFIVPISAFLLVYMEKPLAYLAIQSLINQSKESHSMFFTVTRDQLIIANEVLVNLICWKYKAVANTAKKLNIAIPHVTLTFITCLFVPFMSSKIMSAFMDAFLVEGMDFVVKVVMFFFKVKAKELAAAETPCQFFGCISEAVVVLGDPVMIQKVAANVAKCKICKSFIIKRAVSAASKSFKQSHTSIAPKNVASVHSIIEELKTDPGAKKYLESRDSEQIKHSINIVRTAINCEAGLETLLVTEMVQNMAPVVDNRGTLLTAALLFKLRDDMPRIHLNHKAVLIYSMNNGTTLTALAEHGDRRKTACVLMVKTTAGTIGAFLSHGLSPSRGFYGSPTTFVFKCDPYTRFIARPPPNAMFISLVTDEALFIGGPEPAIYIDKYLEHLVTAECETFASPRLFEPPMADIISVELYALE